MIQPARLTSSGWIILALIFFVYLFLVFDAAFPGPDEPIYYSYTASAVQDGDLNPVNHPDPRYPFTLPSGKLGVSKTYNLPDFHAHGGVLVWAPFYVYAKLVYLLADKTGLSALSAFGFDRLGRAAMAFSTALFAFLTLLLTYQLARLFFSRRQAAISCLVIFFGTPFFFFTAREPGNANILAGLFSVISIWFCLQVINREKIYWFLYGLFFSVCLAVKVDLWFQLCFLSILFLVLLKRKQASWAQAFCFILGLVPVALLKTANDYIKYGSFHIGEAGAFTLKSNYLFELLFSSYRGFFYTSPVFYICVLGLALAAGSAFKRQSAPEKTDSLKADMFLVILSAYLMIKVLFFSYNYAWGGGTCGARVLLSEFPLFVLLYARAAKSAKGIWFYILAAVSVLFILWNLLVISEFVAKLDLDYVAHPAALSARIQAVKDVPGAILFKIRDLDIKLWLLLPLLIFVLTVTYRKLKQWKDPAGFAAASGGNFHKGLAVFTAYLCLGYLVLTVANIYNNPRKAQKLKDQGFFANAEILPPGQFERKENTGSLDEMIQYYTLKGDLARADRVREQKQKAYPVF